MFIKASIKSSTIFSKKWCGIKNSRAFTLIELILAIAISLVVVTVLLTVSISGLKYIGEVKTRERLQTEADYLINKLSYSIRQAENLIVESPVRLRVIKDSGEDIFEKDADNFKLNGNSLIANGTRITSLVFTSKDNSVKLDITLNRGDSEFSFKTTLAKRNF